MLYLILGLERWFSGSEHWLLFQRSWVHSQQPHGSLQSCKMRSGALFWPASKYAGRTLHIKNKNKKEKKNWCLGMPVAESRLHLPALSGPAGMDLLSSRQLGKVGMIPTSELMKQVTSCSSMTLRGFKYLVYPRLSSTPYEHVTSSASLGRAQSSSCFGRNSGK